MTRRLTAGQKVKVYLGIGPVPDGYESPDGSWDWPGFLVYVVAAGTLAAAAGLAGVRGWFVIVGIVVLGGVAQRLFRRRWPRPAFEPRPDDDLTAPGV